MVATAAPFRWTGKRKKRNSSPAAAANQGSPLGAFGGLEASFVRHLQTPPTRTWRGLAWHGVCLYEYGYRTYVQYTRRRNTSARQASRVQILPPLSTSDPVVWLSLGKMGGAKGWRWR